MPETPSSLSGPINTWYLLISQPCRGKNIPAHVLADSFRPGDAEDRHRGRLRARPGPETIDRIQLRIMCEVGAEVSKLPRRCDATRQGARLYIRQPAGPPRRIRKQTLVQFGRREHPKTPSPFTISVTHLGFLFRRDRRHGKM